MEKLITLKGIDCSAPLQFSEDGCLVDMHDATLGNGEFAPLRPLTCISDMVVQDELDKILPGCSIQKAWLHKWDRRTHFIFLVKAGDTSKVLHPFYLDESRSLISAADGAEVYDGNVNAVENIGRILILSTDDGMLFAKINDENNAYSFLGRPEMPDVRFNVQQSLQFTKGEITFEVAEYKDYNDSLAIQAYYEAAQRGFFSGKTMICAAMRTLSGKYIDMTVPVSFDHNRHRCANSLKDFGTSAWNGSVINLYESVRQGNEIQIYRAFKPEAERITEDFNFTGFVKELEHDYDDRVDGGKFETCRFSEPDVDGVAIPVYRYLCDFEIMSLEKLFDDWEGIIDSVDIFVTAQSGVVGERFVNGVSELFRRTPDEQENFLVENMSFYKIYSINRTNLRKVKKPLSVFPNINETLETFGYKDESYIKSGTEGGQLADRWKTSCLEISEAGPGTYRTYVLTEMDGFVIPCPALTSDVLVQQDMLPLSEVATNRRKTNSGILKTYNSRLYTGAYREIGNFNLKGVGALFSGIGRYCPAYDSVPDSTFIRANVFSLYCLNEPEGERKTYGEVFGTDGMQTYYGTLEDHAPRIVVLPLRGAASLSLYFERRTVNSDGETVSHNLYSVVDFSKHPALGVPYCIWDNTAIYDSGSTVKTWFHDKQDKAFDYSLNKIKVSELYDPLSFPLSQYYVAGQGEIKAFASILGEMSSGNEYSQYSLYVFCTDGIKAMTAGDADTVCTAIRDVTRDVCNNPDGIVSTTKGLLYTSQQGLKVIAGQASEVATAKIPFNNSDGITDFTPYIGASLSYSYKDDELMLFVPSRDSLIWDMQADVWGYASFRPRFVLRDYPNDFLIADRIFEYKRDLSDGQGRRCGFETRPINLGTPLVAKSIRRVELSGRLQGSGMIAVFGSLDGTEWTSIGYGSYDTGTWAFRLATWNVPVCFIKIKALFDSGGNFRLPAIKITYEERSGRR